MWVCVLSYPSKTMIPLEEAYLLSRIQLFNPMDCSPPGSSVDGDSPGKNTRVGSNALIQGIFPTQGSNPAVLRYWQILYQLSHRMSLKRKINIQILCGNNSILRNIKWEDKTTRCKEETRLRQYTLYLTGMKMKMCLDFN